jgi:hypothetical protein
VLSFAASTPTTSNGEKVGETHNLVPAEGIAYFLNTGMKGGSAITNWYLGLFSANVTPAANWTAANFVASATEIVSGTEGYTQASRPAWISGAVSGGKVSNSGSPARFTIACSTTLNVAGAALLSASAKGAVTGTLVSATRYLNVRTLGNGDQYDIVYELELIDS